MTCFRGFVSARLSACADKRGKDLGLRDLIGTECRIGFFEFLVVLRAQECERRHHGTGADPSYAVKLGSLAGLRPAHEKSRAECTVAAAA